MHASKAIKVAERGPKTEAQRTQAIEALREFARELDMIEHYDSANEATRAAQKLEDMGDVNFMLKYLR